MASRSDSDDTNDDDDDGDDADVDAPGGAMQAPGGGNTDGAIGKLSAPPNKEKTAMMPMLNANSRMWETP